MSNPLEEPGTEEMAEEPLQNGYGNDTGFAAEAEENTGEDGQEAQDGSEEPGSDESGSDRG